MRNTLLVTLALLFAIPAHAQLRWGVRAGVTDGDPMIGGEMVLPLGAGFVFNPNIELSSNVVSTNADFHYDFDLGEVDVWAGAGVALVNPDGQDLDVGVNILAGVGAPKSRWYPYAQVKLTAPSDYDSFTSLAVGIRF